MFIDIILVYRYQRQFVEKQSCLIPLHELDDSDPFADVEDEDDHELQNKQDCMPSINFIGDGLEKDASRFQTPEGRLMSRIPQALGRKV